MARKPDDLLAGLALIATRLRPKSHLDEFRDFLHRDGTIVCAWPEAVKAEGDNIDRYLRPEGGLTKEHFDALVQIDPLARRELAQAVAENLMRRRGFPAIPTHWAAISLGGDYWEQLESDEDFDRATRDVELELFRQRQEETEGAGATDDSGINPYGDWSVIVTPRGTFTLTAMARTVFPIIFHAHKEGRPVTERHIREVTGIEAERIDRCLRTSKIWGAVVAPVPGRRGFWRLLL